MKKKGKDGGKDHENRRDRMGGVRIELEENADDLFLEHVLGVKPWKNEADTMPDTNRPKPSKRLEKVIDLHGLTIEQSKEKILELCGLWLGQEESVRVKIITGKGYGSQGGVGVLVKEIHAWMKREMANKIANLEESPDLTRLNGLPLRGHFYVTLRR